MDPQARKIIEKLGLIPLPTEGGYYRETYRSEHILQPGISGSQYNTLKSLCTAIYYLLTPDTFSRLHRLPSDEIYHFYAGDPVCLLLLHPDGSSQEIMLGNDVPGGEQPQFVIPALSWQGSFLKQGGKYALLGTTMAPGYDQADYEDSHYRELLERSPDKRELILRLSPEK